MIYITNLTQGVAVFRKIAIVHGLNKLEENADSSDFLNLQFTKKKIESGEYVVETNTDVENVVLISDADSADSDEKPKKKKKHKKGETSIDVNIQ